MTEKRSLIWAAGAGVVAIVVLLAIGLSIHWFPPRASTQAASIDHLYHVMLFVSVPIFVLVEGVVLYSIWRFRMRPGQEEQDGPPIHGNTTLEIVWTAIPAFLLVALALYSYVVLSHNEKKRSNEMVVDVTGQQFQWTFGYPHSSGPETKSLELYLPTNQPVVFRVTSKDVIHAFWVPAFRLQTSAVPGQTDTLRVTTNGRQGTYPVICNQLCGLGHATMRSTVHVIPPAQFQAWMTKQQGPAVPAGADPATVGKQTFTSSATGCGGCHTIADAQTTGTIGPPLDKYLHGHDAAFIRQSIVAPNAYVEKGYPVGVMPQNFGSGLQPGQIDALVAYLQKVSR